MINLLDNERLRSIILFDWIVVMEWVMIFIDRNMIFIDLLTNIFICEVINLFIIHNLLDLYSNTFKYSYYLFYYDFLLFF